MIYHGLYWSTLDENGNIDGAIEIWTPDAIIKIEVQDDKSTGGTDYIDR